MKRPDYLSERPISMNWMLERSHSLHPDYPTFPDVGPPEHNLYSHSNSNLLLGGPDMEVNAFPQMNMMMSQRIAGRRLDDFAPEVNQVPHQMDLEDEKSLFGINTWSKILDEEEDHSDDDDSIILDNDCDKMSNHSGSTSSSLSSSHSKEKTALCKFHLLGQCKKGRSCTFAHSKSELREGDDLDIDLKANGKVKTKLCKNLYEYGTCPYGSHCTFAHGKAELKPARSGNTSPAPTSPGPSHANQRRKRENKENKSQICESFFKTGKCPSQGRCSFQHGRAEHRMRI